MTSRYRWFGLAALVLLSAAPQPADAQRGASAARATRPMPPPMRERQAVTQARQDETPRRARVYAVGEHGWRYRRGELLIVSQDDAVLATAVTLGMVPVSRAPLEAAGLLMVTFRAPGDVDARAVRAAIIARHPTAAVDLNYVYEPRGASANAPPRATPDVGARTVGMVDVGVPDIASDGTRLRTLQVSGERAAISRHATTVAAILLGTLRSSAPTLLAADAVERESAGFAAASSIVRGMDWAALEGAAIINVSLAGPPNAALAAVAKALAARGVVIVAAVGNHGPHAPPAYPAAIPDVVAVTAIDAHGQIMRRANQGAHVDFAAPGFSDRNRTGTSFACPVVAGLLARRIERADPGVARRALEELAAAAIDLGASGRDPVFGLGLVTATTW